MLTIHQIVKDTHNNKYAVYYSLPSAPNSTYCAYFDTKKEAVAWAKAN